MTLAQEKHLILTALRDGCGMGMAEADALLRRQQTQRDFRDAAALAALPLCASLQTPETIAAFAYAVADALIAEARRSHDAV